MDLAAYRHFCAALRATRVTREPFAYGYTEGLFPAYYYEQLLANLPPLEAYQAAPSEQRAARVRRHDFWLVPEFLRKLTEPSNFFWTRLAQRVISSETALCLQQAFGDALPRAERLLLRVRLVRESGAYILTPHLDSAEKAAVLVAYLAGDDTRSSLGTTLYRRSANGRFTAFHTLEFRPNCASTLVRGADAWHGGDWSTLSGERNTLHFYFVPDPSGTGSA